MLYRHLEIALQLATWSSNTLTNFVGPASKILEANMNRLGVGFATGDSTGLAVGFKSTGIFLDRILVVNNQCGPAILTVKDLGFAVKQPWLGGALSGAGITIGVFELLCPGDQEYCDACQQLGLTP